MNTPKLFLLACILTCLSSSAAGQDTDSAITVEPARLTIDGKEINYEAGSFAVPENRAKSNSRTIRIGFVRFKGPANGKAPPQFLLPGGPGFSFIRAYLENNDSQHRGRFVAEVLRHAAISDLIIVDQRGYSSRGETIQTFYSPPERNPGRPFTAKQELAAYRTFVETTVEEYAKTHVDLAGYTIKQCAHDVNDLRRALGYRKITLVGTSFGSQWSFAIMRLHPEIVERALLSGVEPLNHSFDMPSHVFAALMRIWRSVEEDERFAPFIPEGGIAEALRVVRRRLDEGPVDLNEGVSGAKPLLFVAEDLNIRNPVGILELYHRHYDGWRRYVRQGAGRSRVTPNLIAPLIDSSLYVTPKRRYELWNDPATRYLGRWNFSRYFATVEVWPSPDVGDDFREPTLCNIPVVFAQGDWDISTPIENTYEVAPYFPNSRVLIAEQGGHGVLGPIGEQLPKTWQSLAKFLETGEMINIPAKVRLKPSQQYSAPDFPLNKAKR